MNTKSISTLTNIFIIVTFMASFACIQNNAYSFQDNIQGNLKSKSEEKIHYYKISKVHPDYREIAEDLMFVEYIDNLPLKQRKVAEHTIRAGSASEVIELLSDYKEDSLHLRTTKANVPELYIEDRANIIDAQTENMLNTYLAALESKTGTLMTVLTIGTTNGKPVRDFFYEVAKKRTLDQLEKTSHLFIVVASNDRKYSIKLGSELKTLLPSNYCADIGKDIFTPNFRKGNYSNGIYLGAVKIINKIAQEEASIIHTIGETVALYNELDVYVGLYKDPSLMNMVDIFTNWTKATIMDMKVSSIEDSNTILYKVQIHGEDIGWVTEDVISG